MADMQVVEADRSLWRSIPGRWSTVVMAVVGGAVAVSSGLIAGAIAYFLLCLVRRQFKWFPERQTWGFVAILLVPVSRVAFWLSLAFLLVGLWRQEGVNPLWGLPLYLGWRLALIAIERTKLSLL